MTYGILIRYWLLSKFLFVETSLGNRGIKISHPPLNNLPEIIQLPSQKMTPEEPTSDFKNATSDSRNLTPEVQLITHTRSVLVTPRKTGLILRAVNDVEDQFWGYSLIEREDSIIMLSLYYLQKLLRF